MNKIQLYDRISNIAKKEKISEESNKKWGKSKNWLLPCCTLGTSNGHVNASRFLWRLFFVLFTYRSSLADQQFATTTRRRRQRRWWRRRRVSVTLNEYALALCNADNAISCESLWYLGSPCHPAPSFSQSSPLNVRSYKHVSFICPRIQQITRINYKGRTNNFPSHLNRKFKCKTISAFHLILKCVIKVCPCVH